MDCSGWFVRLCRPRARGPLCLLQKNAPKTDNFKHFGKEDERSAKYSESDRSANALRRILFQGNKLDVWTFDRAFPEGSSASMGSLPRRPPSLTPTQPGNSIPQNAQLFWVLRARLQNNYQDNVPQ